MTNLEKFYPGKTLDQFEVEGSPLAHEPDDSRCRIDCMECEAFDFCQHDANHVTCIESFKAWLKLEAV